MTITLFGLCYFYDIKIRVLQYFISCCIHDIKRHVWQYIKYQLLSWKSGIFLPKKQKTLNFCKKMPEKMGLKCLPSSCRSSKFMWLESSQKPFINWSFEGSNGSGFCGSFNSGLCWRWCHPEWAPPQSKAGPLSQQRRREDRAESAGLYRQGAVTQLFISFRMFSSVIVRF